MKLSLVKQLYTVVALDKPCTSYASAVRKSWKCIFKRTEDLNLQIVSLANSTETEYLGGNGGRRKCLDKSLVTVFLQLVFCYCSISKKLFLM